MSGILSSRRARLIAVLVVVYLILGTALDGISMIVLTSAVVLDRKSTRLNSSHMSESRMPSSA